MKLLFYLSIIGLIVFEIALVFFIMPMPGSQEIDSLDVTYFLHQWRWGFRGILIAICLFSLTKYKWKYKIIPVLLISIHLLVFYLFNFKMAADHMFYQPNQILMKNTKENVVDYSRLVIGIQYHGHARAYPIQYIGYHHQVIDTLEGDPVMITYCTVCRTGRVYIPKVSGKNEKFRLVGMDHFNALFEDNTTGSWWQQSTGEAIVGPLKGAQLPELFSQQMTLGKWVELYPNCTIMQPDSHFQSKYDSLSMYETTGKGKLTKTDTTSWHNKSWVVGLKVKNSRKAFDWNQLKKDRIIHDFIDGTPVLVILSHDNKSFFAFERPSPNDTFTLRNDTLFTTISKYNIHGIYLESDTINIRQNLKPIQAYQEFWHSWQTFQKQGI